MLRRLLFAITLATCTLLVAGTAQASGPSVRAPATTATVADQPNPPCMWKGDCYQCYDYRTAKWTVQHCDGGSAE